MIIKNNKNEEEISKLVDDQFDDTDELEAMGPDLNEIGYQIENDIKPKKDKKKIILLISLLLILLLVIILIIGFFTLTIKLNGKSNIELNYNDSYIEEKAKATFLGKDLSKNIKIKGKVDTSKIGSYKLTYSLKIGFVTVKKERIVKIIDKKAPMITLTGEKSVNICPNKEYEEEGFTANDEYDGILTDKVITSKTDDGILYKVSDLSGNSYSITRKINKVDDEKPVINLKGSSTIYLSIYDEYKEPGYTVDDNCSDNLSNKVTISGEVKNKEEGTYTLTYSVKDDNNNKASVTRKVIISNKTDANSGISKPGVIYLTFDDGPSGSTTPHILDVLKEEGVKATFFVTNSGPDELIKRMFEEGHTVALHTASHNYQTIYSSEEAYFRDLKLVSDRVERLTGEVSKIVRFPGGSSNTVSRRYSSGIMSRLSEALFSQGYRYYDWNVDSNDAGNCSKNDVSDKKSCVYNYVTRNLSKQQPNMVLMHDIKSYTSQAIQDIIRYGKNNGYTFERIEMDTKMVRQRINN